MDATSTAAPAADARWRALVQRQPGDFVYAVRTTGVFCRPGCGSRRPRRENVLFFAGAAEAQAAGYRPCKRCRPGAVPWTVEVASRACRLIDERPEAPPSLAELAAAVGVSRFHLLRLFRAVVGATPKQYVQAQRARAFRDRLAAAGSVTEAALDAGLASGHGTRRAALGLPPATRRAGGAGATLGVAAQRSSLGFIVVGASSAGICSVELVDHADEGRRRLRALLPAAALEEGAHQADRWARLLAAAVEAPASTSLAALPLDLRGSAFQARVWQLLRAIPAGATVTYQQLARRLGLPRGARAVARACATNPAALVVPCHRVVRADGQPSGYRWGLPRKAALLSRER